MRPELHSEPRRMRPFALRAGASLLAPLAAIAVCAAGCDPQILVGADLASDAGSGAATAAIAIDGGFDGSDGEIMVPWSTGFESGFSDWYEPPNQGFCYVEGLATYAIVSSPVHSGQYAAAFTVDTSDSSPALPSQTRCVRQGVLPQAAYYGAWYFVPQAATSETNWNLFHFQGGDGPDASDIHGLWDVSLGGAAGAPLTTETYDFLGARTLEGGVSIPIGQWFHLEVFLRRAADGTGEFTLTQDGQVVATVSGVETDDSQWGQWYVGNFAVALTPPTSTVYVDDVTIGTTPSSP